MPRDMYGKIMSLPDELIKSYFEYLTDMPDQDLAALARDLENDAVNPMDFKKQLAREITAQFHDQAAADEAQADFERVVQRRALPQEIPDFNEPSLTAAYQNENRRLSNIIVEAGLAPSVTEAKRLINQGAVQAIDEANGDSRTLERDEHSSRLDLQHSTVLKVGRRRFVRLVKN